jgi:hypothetical protein
VRHLVRSLAGGRTVACPLRKRQGLQPLHPLPVVDHHEQDTGIDTGPLPDEAGEPLPVDRVAHVSRHRIPRLRRLDHPLGLAAGSGFGGEFHDTLEGASLEGGTAGLVGQLVGLGLGPLLSGLGLGGTGGDDVAGGRHSRILLKETYRSRWVARCDSLDTYLVGITRQVTGDGQSPCPPGVSHPKRMGVSDSGAGTGDRMAGRQPAGWCE